MGISVATLRNWEQGRRKPEGPARVLLMVAAKHPEVLLDLSGQPEEKGQQIDRHPENYALAAFLNTFVCSFIRS